MKDPKFMAKILAEQIEPNFKQIHGDRYELQIVNDIDSILGHASYSFFFMRQPKNGSKIISPVLHILDSNLEELEATLKEFEKYYQFTRVYRGFVGELWPSNGRPIQKKKAPDEL